ncbi:transposase [Plakobranchus ocellatus]|uniref:Transposase n=1 Tax=Plakobranchus ocellatus TaxID=259542 RepID=A0AAV4BPU3_9GAST|nr:transposase [Plakobranchus ocellatus]
MQKENHFCNAFRLETNPGSTTTNQNVKPNRWSIGTKLLQVQGSSRLLPLQERSCSPFFFWDMEGVVHMKFLEQGQTVNSERYISTLQALKLRLRCVRHDKDLILQHDNARPHISRQTQDALRQLELTTLPHPAYSSDLAPL